MDHTDKIRLTDEYMKLEIAAELGLIDQVAELGWSSLSAQQTGKIGGLLRAKKQKQKTDTGK